MNTYIQMRADTKKHILWTVAIVVAASLLVYTRFVNLGWGLPFAMHPDERNMAWAIMRLSPIDMYNPHFFAYGQLPLYAAAILVSIHHKLASISGPITYEEAVIALRAISAVSSVFSVLIMVRVMGLLSKASDESKNRRITLIASMLFTCSPVLIQLSHYGTTESLLIFFYCALIYISVLFFQGLLKSRRYYVLSAIICGLAVATKVSALVYTGIPGLFILGTLVEKGKPRFTAVLETFFKGVKFLCWVLYVSFIFSPFNFIDFNGFLGSMRYESDVALGKADVFYTRSFWDTIPVVFQFVRVFPYSLGTAILILAIIGFLFLPYTRRNNLLRYIFLIVFLPNAFMYTKWTRFLAPAYPVMILLAVLFLADVYAYIERAAVSIWKVVLKVDFAVLVLLALVPGIAYVSIYASPDVRFTASYWVDKNIPANAKILSETANVVDLPIFPADSTVTPKPYEYISFDFYNIDTDKMLYQQFEQHKATADYIYVPSRRVFMNHTCIQEPDQPYSPQFMSISREITHGKDYCRKLEGKYPSLNQYYDDLFTGRLGYRKVAEFSSFPRITLFGRTIAEFPDEQAEETWTVFDHPVIRIYKKTY